jgi:hypothetical protein
MKRTPYLPMPSARTRLANARTRIDTMLAKHPDQATDAHADHLHRMVDDEDAKQLEGRRLPRRPLTRSSGSR